MCIGRRDFLHQLTWISASVSTGVVLSGCRTAPITGRKQLLLMPEDQERQMGLTAYQEVVQKEKPSNNPSHSAMVARVGGRIAAVAQRDDYEWEFRALESAEMNAFALPGGKVAIYEGILGVCQNEAGLAVVMSHEVAHALARHGGERMSQNYAVDGVKQAVNFVMQKQDQASKERILQAYGVASQYGVLLPYSRKHESEADHMGIMLMAQAGYDPAEAPRFWQRFGAVGGAKPPEFLSTHPSDERRSENLRGLLPEAQEFYAKAPTKYGLGDAIQAVAIAPGTPAGNRVPAGPAQNAAPSLWPSAPNPPAWAPGPTS